MGEAKLRTRRCVSPGTTALPPLLGRISLRDDHIDSLQATARSATDMAGLSMYSTPRFLRRDAHALRTVRSLPNSANLILFTPVVPPEQSPGSGPGPPSVGGGGSATALQHQENGHHRNMDAPMDPFEPFGRALALYHSRVRHVPYVPRSGMTATHRTFLKHASVVVLVVVCNNHLDLRQAFSHNTIPHGLPLSIPSRAPVHQPQPPDRPLCILPPLGQALPAAASLVTPKTEPRPSPHHAPHRQQARDDCLQFALQALVLSEDAHEHVRSKRNDGPVSLPIPTVLLFVGGDKVTQKKVEELDNLTENAILDRTRRCVLEAKTVLLSRSYSAETLRKVATLIFGVDGQGA